jgi:hypothetical protein
MHNLFGGNILIKSEKPGQKPKVWAVTGDTYRSYPLSKTQGQDSFGGAIKKILMGIH